MNNESYDEMAILLLVILLVYGFSRENAETNLCTVGTEFGFGGLLRSPGCFACACNIINGSGGAWKDIWQRPKGQWFVRIPLVDHLIHACLS
jgi:hypothetical protein